MDSPVAQRPQSTAQRLTARQEAAALRRARKLSGEDAGAIGTPGHVTQSHVAPSQILPLPRWVLAQPEEGSEPEQAFAAGAAMLALDQIQRQDTPWLGALRMRLALQGAVTIARMLRLNADAATLRDAEHLTRAGDDPGPAGRLHRLLRQFAAQPLRKAQTTLDALHDEMGNAAAGSDIIGFLMADNALATRMGWAVPLLLHLPVVLDASLRRTEAGKRPGVDARGRIDNGYTVLAHAACQAHARAVALQRRAEALGAVAAGLRTRGGSLGVDLILADDAVAPWKMIEGIGRGRGLGSDRAARRFCDTLSDRGVLQLFTTRPTFRLYGL